jgi:hypothetical protein
VTDALRKFLYEKDALGTATVIEVTPEELKALMDEAAEHEHCSTAGCGETEAWNEGYDAGYADGKEAA